MNISHKIKILAIFIVIFIVAKLLTANNFFFWDTIQLGAKHACYYFDNNLKIGFLPDSIDSGHIPFFGYYLALVWTIFGKSLFVSHFAMIPFIIGIIVQLHKLLELFFEKQNIFFVMVLVFADPSISSQLLLISPDIFLLFFYLLTLNATLYGKRNIKITGAIGLCLISMRGMIALFSIFIVDFIPIIQTKENKFKSVVKAAFIYLPAVFLALLFFMLHYIEKGWFGFHSNSPWASSFELSTFKEIGYNVFILIWRFVDFGRIFLWLFFFVGFIFVFRNRIIKNKKVEIFLRYFLAFILAGLPIWLFFKSMAMHRYLLPGILLFTIIVALVIQECFNKHKKIYFFLLTFLLISGNFWVYPDKIAMGWDATLAHIPYYSLHEKMVNFMLKNEIPINNTGSAFPNLADARYIYLDETKDITFLPYDFKQNRYIFQSNVYNDFSDNELDILINKWNLIKEYKMAKVYIRLYKNPNYE